MPESFVWTRQWRGLPSIGRWIDSAAASLRDGNSLVALLPEGRDPEGLWQAVRESLDQQGCYTADFYLPDLAQAASREEVVAKTPAELLCWGLEAEEAQGAVTVDEAVAALSSPYKFPKVIGLRGYDLLPSARRPEWNDLMSRWGAAAHAQVNQGLDPPALCLITTFSVLPAPPAPDARLSIRSWWGAPDALDIHCYCRDASGGGSASTTSLRDRWREYLLASLGSADPQLIEFLWDKCDGIAAGQGGEMCATLVEYGHARGWNANEIGGALDAALGGGAPSKARSGTILLGSPQTRPPAAYRALTAAGILYAASDTRVEVHSAALALLDQHGELHHRFWRGQASLVYPFLYEVRSALCRRITNRLGVGWPTRWWQPPDEQKRSVTDHDCELSYLRVLLKECGLQFREELNLSPLVDLGSRLRNDLAHHNLISVNDYEELERVFHRLFATDRYF